MSAAIVRQWESRSVSPIVLVSCAACGKRNRLGYISLGKTTRCGHCKAEIPSPTAPVHAATAAAFDAALRDSALPLVVDFWAPWCGPCRMVAPVLEELAGEMAGRLLVAKLNVDENPATAARFGVSSIPTLLLLKAGREIDRIVGAQSKPEIARRVERAIA